MKSRLPILGMRLRSFIGRPSAVAGAAACFVSMVALVHLGWQIQLRARESASRFLQGGVATEQMLAGASDCTKRYLHMNYTSNGLVVMAEDVRTMEANCRGLERHKAMVDAQREALGEVSHSGKSLAQRGVTSSTVN